MTPPGASRTSIILMCGCVARDSSTLICSSANCGCAAQSMESALKLCAFGMFMSWLSRGLKNCLQPLQKCRRLPPIDSSMVGPQCEPGCQTHDQAGVDHYRARQYASD